MTKQQLIEDNMKLVHFVLNKYYPKCAFDEDLIQAGMVGLCKAANTYDETKSKFNTYAIRCILNDIRMEFRSRAKHPPMLSLDYTYDEDGEGPVSFGEMLTGDEDVDYVDISSVYKRLTPLQQQIFDMKRVGMTKNEVARELGYSLSYITKQVRIIKSKLKLFMEE